MVFSISRNADKDDGHPEKISNPPSSPVASPGLWWDRRKRWDFRRPDVRFDQRRCSVLKNHWAPEPPFGYHSRAISSGRGSPSSVSSVSMTVDIINTSMQVHDLFEAGILGGYLNITTLASSLPSIDNLGDFSHAIDKLRQGLGGDLTIPETRQLALAFISLLSLPGPQKSAALRQMMTVSQVTPQQAQAQAQQRQQSQQAHPNNA
jgi:hypothetical protein